ncbi:MAG: hypothetical protein ACREJ4_07865, partial [Candidatus Methylomirabilaceae bacterium]
LRLRRAISEGERRPPAPGGAATAARYPNFRDHATGLAKAVDEIKTAHLARPQTLGVDPRLVLVFELNESVDLEEFRKADLLVLDASQSKVVVAFADDPQLAGFLERLGKYQAGPAEGKKRPPLVGLGRRSRSS